MERPTRRIVITETPRSGFTPADGVLTVFLRGEELVGVDRKSDRKGQGKERAFLERPERRLSCVQNHLVQEIRSDDEQPIERHLRMAVEEHCAGGGAKKSDAQEIP